MAIPLSLLKATESRATGMCTYGGAGLKKTHFASTMPPPVWFADIGEGGTGSLLPWIRRRRNWDQPDWTWYTNEDRQEFLNMLDEPTRKGVTLKPGPYVDVVSYDNSSTEAWSQFSLDIANFDLQAYNTLALDSLQEFSVLKQTQVKGDFLANMNDIPFGWVRVQEQCGIHLRKIRNWRNAGVFVYLTAAQDIAKDYVKNPMAKRDRGDAEPEAYSVKGTVQMPGQLAEALTHLPDILCRAKLVSGTPVFITEPEMLPGGGAHWDAKDRFGRLPRVIGGQECPLSFRSMMDLLYGPAGKKLIMAHCANMVKEVAVGA